MGLQSYPQQTDCNLFKGTHLVPASGVGRNLSQHMNAHRAACPGWGQLLPCYVLPQGNALDSSLPRARSWRASMVVVRGQRGWALSWAPECGAVSGWEPVGGEAERRWEAERQFSWVPETLAHALFIWLHKMQISKIKLLRISEKCRLLNSKIRAPLSEGPCITVLMAHHEASPWYNAWSSQSQ